VGVTRSGLTRTAAVVGASVGVAAAGAAVGVVTRRYLAARARQEPDPYADEPFGRLRGMPVNVRTDDGVRLHVEVDEPTAWPRGPQLTIVLCHGFALNLDVWHFQRKALRPLGRIVAWDQRSHGRSQRAKGKEHDNERLTHDLEQVLDQVVPEGPVVLIGHSMGGMTILGLAGRRPEMFGSRVVGVGLIATSGGRLSEVPILFRGPLGRLAHRAAPTLAAILARQPELVEHGRRAGADLAFAMTKKYSYGTDVPDSIARFSADMIAQTPIDVVADLLPSFDSYDASEGIKVLDGVPTTIIGADRDLVTPIEHSHRLAELLPSATYLEVPDSGHLVLLEHPDVATGALVDLVERAAATVPRRGRRGRGGTGTTSRRRPS
jgi:pimeloyl-ACP methyl ester carboxylesterase